MYIKGIGRVRPSPEELSKIRREVGRLGGLKGGKIGGKLSHGGGRPLGSKDSKPRVVNPKPKDSYTAEINKVLTACAKFDGVSVPKFVKRIADDLRANPRYAHLFAKPPAPPDAPASPDPNAT